MSRFRVVAAVLIRIAVLFVLLLAAAVLLTWLLGWVGVLVSMPLDLVIAFIFAWRLFQ